MKYFNPSTRVFILRVAREDLQTAETSIALMSKVNGVDGDIRVRILHVGGTLEKVEKALKKMTEAWLEGAQVKANMI